MSGMENAGPIICSHCGKNLEGWGTGLWETVTQEHVDKGLIPSKLYTTWGNKISIDHFKICSAWKKFRGQLEH